MADLSTIISRLSGVDVMALAGQAAIDSKDDYLMRQVSQLEQGQDSMGEATSLDGFPGYQPATIYHKIHYGVGLGAVVDYVTLYDTGKMHESADIVIDNDQINVIFNVDYAQEVLARTTDIILGLDDENKSAYINGEFFQAFKALFESQTQLKLE
jgi:hypothetical protein